MIPTRALCASGLPEDGLKSAMLQRLLDYEAAQAQSGQGQDQDQGLGVGTVQEAAAAVQEEAGESRREIEARKQRACRV